MKKALLIIATMLCLVSAIFASTFDLAFSVGQDNYKWWNDGISFSYGMNIGVSERIEFSFWGISEAVPKPFKGNMVGVDVSIGLLGRRTSGTKVAGSGINTLLSIGGFYRTEDSGLGPIISITPLTVGNPITGRRERLLRTGLGWDFINSKLVVTFSLLNLDLYVKGSYRDYEY